MTPPAGRTREPRTLSGLDACVLRQLPMVSAGASWPTAGQVAARLAVAVDVACSSLQRLQGRYLAEHDPLSGLRNRRTFEAGLARASASSRAWASSS